MQLTCVVPRKPQQKTALQKTSHDLQMSLVAFQRAQQVSAERQRTVVQGVKLAVDDEQNYPPYIVITSLRHKPEISF